MFVVAILAAAGIARPGLYFSKEPGRRVEGTLPVHQSAARSPFARALAQRTAAYRRAAKPAKVVAHDGERLSEIAVEAGGIGDPEDLPPRPGSHYLASGSRSNR